MTDLIKKLVQTHSVAGEERALAEIIKQELKNDGADISTDHMGNLIVRKKSGGRDAKLLALVANMDTPGLIATHIEENGQVRAANLGTLDYSSLAFSKVSFLGGPAGFVIPAGEIDRDFTANRLYIDIGADTRQSAQELVSPGDVIGIGGELTPLSNGRLAAFSIGAKVCCALLLEWIKNTVRIQNDLVVIFTSQRQLGARGSSAAFGALSPRPHTAVILDVTPVNPPQQNRTPITPGKGVAVRAKDHGAVYSPQTVSLLTRIAREHSIPYQTEILGMGHNDALSVNASGFGTLIGCLALPVSHMNTASETIDLRDMEACGEILRLLAGEEL